MWIARDKCGDIGIYGNKPTLSRTGTTWNKPYCDFISIDKTQYTEITFENSPQKIEILI